jgi:hypothetical protein
MGDQAVDDRPRFTAHAILDLLSQGDQRRIGRHLDAQFV